MNRPVGLKWLTGLTVPVVLTRSTWPLGAAPDITPADGTGRTRP